MTELTCTFDFSLCMVGRGFGDPGEGATLVCGEEHRLRHRTGDFDGDQRRWLGSVSVMMGRR